LNVINNFISQKLMLADQLLTIGTLKSLTHSFYSKPTMDYEQGLHQLIAVHSISSHLQ